MTEISAKAAYVLRQGQTRNHECHWPDCTEQVPPARWGCRWHWFLLPPELRTAIWQTFRPGQEVNGTPSAAYVAVARRVQEWIAGYLASSSTSSTTPPPAASTRSGTAPASASAVPPPALLCRSCGEAVRLIIAFDDREGCAACWLAGRASSSPGGGDSTAARDGSRSTSDGPQRQRRVWNKGSARNAGPKQPDGTVLVTSSRLRPCEHCGRLWYGGGAHACRLFGPRLDAAMPQPGPGTAPEAS